jgi:hypothetical protein
VGPGGMTKDLGLKPDFLTIGKALAAGIPTGTFGMTQEIADAIKKMVELEIIDLGGIKTKYPKFCFRQIHPNNINYYWDKKEALKAFKICSNKLINDIGKEKYRRLDSRYKLNKINELDKKIPIINFDLYYPKD